MGQEKEKWQQAEVASSDVPEAGKYVPAEGWASIGWGQALGGTQDRGNSRGCGFMSGQEADLELEGALKNQGYSSAHSRTLSVRIIPHRYVPDQFF